MANRTLVGGFDENGIRKLLLFAAVAAAAGLIPNRWVRNASRVAAIWFLF
jgi:hypothetical protein